MITSRLVVGVDGEIDEATLAGGIFDVVTSVLARVAEEIVSLCGGGKAPTASRFPGFLSHDLSLPFLLAALLELTKQRTVPNVFVNGQHLGGCDDTMAAISSGKLAKMLRGEL